MSHAVGSRSMYNTVTFNRAVINKEIPAFSAILREATDRDIGIRDIMSADVRKLPSPDSWKMAGPSCLWQATLSMRNGYTIDMALIESSQEYRLMHLSGRQFPFGAGKAETAVVANNKVQGSFEPVASYGRIKHDDPAPLRRRNGLPVPSKSLTHVPELDGSTDSLICSCQHTTLEPFCPAVKEWIRAQQDRKLLRKLKDKVEQTKLGGKKRPRMRINVPFSAMIKVPIWLEFFTAEDLEDDQDRFRLFFSDEVSVWMDKDTTLIHVMIQVVDVLKASTEFKRWSTAVTQFLDGEIEGGFPCPNRFHDSQDEAKIRRTLSDTVEQHDSASAFELLEEFVANMAYSSKYEGRCIMCKLRFNPDNDVPTL